MRVAGVGSEDPQTAEQISPTWWKFDYDSGTEILFERTYDLTEIRFLSAVATAGIQAQGISGRIWQVSSSGRTIADSFFALKRTDMLLRHRATVGHLGRFPRFFEFGW